MKLKSSGKKKELLCPCCAGQVHDTVGTVRYSHGTYIARLFGKTASCTAEPCDHAALAVAAKIFGDRPMSIKWMDNAKRMFTVEEEL